MPNPVLPSLDAADVWGALAAVADRPAGSEARAALVSALALRHTELPRATPSGGARVLPFPGGRVRGAAPGSGEAPVVPLSRARGSALAGVDAARPCGTAEESARSAPAAEVPVASPEGAVRLVPAPGSVPGLDEGPVRLTVFRSLDSGRLLGREVGVGARVVVSRREPGPLDVAVYATRRTVGLCPAGAPPPGGRILGTVEAVIQ